MQNPSPTSLPSLNPAVLTSVAPTSLPLRWWERWWQMVSNEFLPLIALAVPLVAGLASSTLIGLTDTYFIGFLGSTELAAASLTGSFNLIVGAALYGFVGPVGVLVGQAWGAGENQRIPQILRHGMVLALVVGVVGFALMSALLNVLPLMEQPPEVIAIIPPYWLMVALALIPFTLSLIFKQLYDSIDRPWTGLGLILTGVLFNVPLTWALVTGQAGFPALGMVGAGLATLLSQIFSAIVMMGYYLFAPSMKPYRGQALWRVSSFHEQIRDGIPMAIQYLSEGGAVALAGILIGWLGEVALAANQIVFSVASLLYMLPLGMSTAVSIRIAQAVGGDEYGRVRAIGFTANSVVVLWMMLFTLTLVVAGGHIARAFISDETVIGVATWMFITVGFMQVFDGIQSVSLGALRGMLDVTYPTLVSLVAYWMVALPLSYVFGFVLEWGAAGVWAGFGFGLAVAASLLIVRFARQTAKLQLQAVPIALSDSSGA